MSGGGGGREGGRDGEGDGEGEREGEREREREREGERERGEVKRVMGVVWLHSRFVCKLCKTDWDKMRWNYENVTTLEQTTEMDAWLKL